MAVGLPQQKANRIRKGLVGAKLRRRPLDPRSKCGGINGFVGVNDDINVTVGADDGAYAQRMRAEFGRSLVNPRGAAFARAFYGDAHAGGGATAIN